MADTVELYLTVNDVSRTVTLLLDLNTFGVVQQERGMSVLCDSWKRCCACPGSNDEG